MYLGMSLWASSSIPASTSVLYLLIACVLKCLFLLNCETYAFLQISHVYLTPLCTVYLCCVKSRFNLKTLEQNAQGYDFNELSSVCSLATSRLVEVRVSLSWKSSSISVVFFAGPERGVKKSHYFKLWKRSRLHIIPYLPTGWRGGEFFAREIGRKKN